MSEAKNATKRQANSVNWRILSTDEADISPIDFERPVFIEKRPCPIPNHLAFNDYSALRSFYTQKKFSGSKQRILANAIIQSSKDPYECESKLIHAAARGDKIISYLLVDDAFRDNATDQKPLDLTKLATFLELLNIKCEGE